MYMHTPPNDDIRIPPHGSGFFDAFPGARGGRGNKDLLGKEVLDEVAMGVEVCFGVGAEEGGGESRFGFNAEGNVMQGIDTIQSNQDPAGGAAAQLQYEDDSGLLSDRSDNNDNDEDDNEEEDSDKEFADASDASREGAPAVNQRQGQGPRAPFNLPELNILPSSPAMPTPGASLPTAIHIFLSSAAGEDVPRASVGLLQPSSVLAPTSVSKSRFNSKKLASAWPAADMQGNLAPPRARGDKGSLEKKANKERGKKKKERRSKVS
ncbi:hypothetical protein CVT25_007545 [Psilocybe cyanescens]|uniref:Uncharacterized protein n=1 Tax=Psilocybe cyanescens TaxID=93625 RepID=A0A409WVW5_PSICY|nr:hypothetical protein CVT25_007545 [Psilocybe cyanescens]